MAKIEKHHPNFIGLKWVLKARGKDKSKPVFMLLYVKDEEMVCSDGYRLHISKISGLENGFYEVVKVSESVIYLEKNNDESLRFPDFQSVVKPDSENRINLEYTSYDFKNCSYVMALCGLHLRNEDMWGLNADHVKDALSFADWRSETFIHFYQPSDPVKITWGCGTAILMPFKLK